jgi:hypothetical protein
MERLWPQLRGRIMDCRGPDGPRNDEGYSFATGSKAPPGTALETGEQ